MTFHVSYLNEVCLAWVNAFTALQAACYANYLGTPTCDIVTPEGTWPDSSMLVLALLDFVKSRIAELAEIPVPPTGTPDPIALIENILDATMSAWNDYAPSDLRNRIILGEQF